MIRIFLGFLNLVLIELQFLSGYWIERDSVGLCWKQLDIVYGLRLAYLHLMRSIIYSMC